MVISPELYAEKEPDFVEGDGHYDLDVVRVSHWQKRLKSLCGGYSIKGSYHEAVAKLHYENGNPDDSNAIRVVVNGGTVGYLSRENARLYRKAIETAGKEGIVVSCNAKIAAGRRIWFFKKPDFGVWLDLPIEKL